MKKFTISILTYRAYPLVKACIESVIKHSPLCEIEVILTNNGNKNGAGEYFDSLARDYPGVFRVFHNEDNQGFISPNVKALEASNTEYFVMLNDDAVVPFGWLEALEQPFKEFPKAALSGLSGGCQSLNADFHGRHGPDFEYLEGSCLMCKSETVKKHGLFSSYLTFAYGEDSDLSLRMRKLGYTLHKVHLHLQHVRAQTAKYIPNIGDIQAKNHAVLKKKWNHYLRVRKFDYPILVRRWAARGDALLVSAIIKRLSEENPLSPIYVETAFPELFNGNPYVKQAATTIPRTFDMHVINLDMAYENRVDMPIVRAYEEVADIEPQDEWITSVHYTEQDVVWADQFLGGAKTHSWVAIHPGPTTWPGKNWPMERFSELAKKLREELGLKVVLVGSGDTTPVSCDRDARGVLTANRTAALIANCELFIGVDSFPLHLAQAVKVPVVGLFGATIPSFILTHGSEAIAVCGDSTASDYGVRHRKSGQTSVETNGEAMKTITVEKVMDAVATSLNIQAR